MDKYVKWLLITVGYYVLLNLAYYHVCVALGIAPSPSRTVIFQLLLYTPLTKIYTTYGLINNPFTYPKNLTFGIWLRLFIAVLFATACTSNLSKLIFSNSPMIQEFPFLPNGFLAFLSIVIIAPIGEEIVFRNFLVSSFAKFMPNWTAIVIPAILFCLVHVSIKYAIGVFGMGLVVSYIFYVTRSTLLTISIHAVSNLIGYATFHANMKPVAAVGESPVRVIASVCLIILFGLISAILTMRTCDRLKRLNE